MRFIFYRHFNDERIINYEWPDEQSLKTTKKGISINKEKKDTKTHPLDKGSRFAVLP